MDKFIFYDINPDYLDYMRTVEPKIPELSKTENEKPFCGIVLEINDMKYYAPISSTKKQQHTNFVIKDRDGNRDLSSIRFCFMLPVPDDVLTPRDFNSMEKKYKDLLVKEYIYCNLPENITTIRKIAKRVYNMCVYQSDPNNKIVQQCCDFKKLEEAYEKYKLIKQQVGQEIEEAHEQASSEKDNKI